jgi:terminase large subunit-like protein
MVCIREVQKTLAQSAKLLIENKIQEFGVGSEFRVLYDRIVTPGDGLIIFQGMVDTTAESIKSLEGYHIAWVEEAQTLSQSRSAPPDHPRRDFGDLVLVEPEAQVGCGGPVPPRRCGCVRLDCHEFSCSEFLLPREVLA